MKTYEILIDEFSVDLYDPTNEDIALTFSLADHTSLAVRKNSNSKTIKIPETQNNSKLFGHLQEINSVPIIDQTRRPIARLLAEGEQLIKGYCKATLSKRTNAEGDRWYELLILGDNGDWRAKIKDRKLSDCDYESDNHLYTKPVIETSETVSASRNYVYDLIDRGKFGGINGDSVNIADRYPAINFRSIWDKIFHPIGYKIVSAFLDSSVYTGLYWAFVNDFLRHPDTFNDTLRCKAEKTNGTQTIQNYGFNTYISNAIINFNDESTGSNFDNGQVWGTPSAPQRVYDVKTNGQYHLKFIIPYQTVGATDINFNPTALQPTGFVYFTVYRYNVFTGAPANILYQTSIPWSVTSGTITIDQKFNLEYGDYVYLEVEININQIWVGWPDQRVYVLNSATVECVEVLGVLQVQEGQLVDMTVNLPQTKQLEFIQGNKDLFGLHFFTDIDTRTVYIEPRDQFYKTTVKAENDWTELLDPDREIDIQFLGSNLSKTIRYKYKDDSKDKFVDEWQKQNQKDLGAYDATILNAYAKDDILEYTNTIFSPTWMDKCDRIGIKTDKIPRMWTDVDPVPPKNTSFNPRILYYRGLKTLQNGESWRFNAIGTVYEQTYNPSTPRTTWPEFTAWDNDSVNTNNLYFEDNDYSSGLFQKYFKTAHKIIDEGRMFVAWFKLTDRKIANLDLREPIVLFSDKEPAYFIINEIQNYRSRDGVSTRVELIKLVASVPIAKLPYKKPNFIASTLPPGPGPVLSVGSDDVGSGSGSSTLRVGGQPWLTRTRNGVIQQGGGNVLAEIDGILQPVYYEDENGNFNNVIIQGDQENQQ